MKTGSIDLPLHPGKCPAWLFKRMRPLTKAISELIINEYGTIELLKRISDPLFFQSLSCTIGFDWHSSGTTTTTCGALKEALSADIGVVACGGKGKVSRKTPDEITQHSEYFNLSDSKTNALLEATKLSAKVDSSCVQDNYDLYHHSFLFDEHGNWAVVQQGMNHANKYARRYHWLQTENFTESPPENISGMKKEEEGSVLNLVSNETQDTRLKTVELVQDNPNRLRRYFTGQTTLLDTRSETQDIISLPERHEILKCDLSKKDWEMLHNAYELQPKNYKELISLDGIGKKKLRALALVSKLIYGTKLDWKDPVKYSFAHGGKDGIHYPVDRTSYDHTIGFLRDVIDGADIDANERRMALRRLGSIA